MRLLFGLLVTLVVLSAGVARPAQEVGSTGAAVDLELFSVSNWLGQLEPLTSSEGSSIGGAALLGAYLRAERDASTLTLATGNSFGSSPPISNLFDDLPAVEAMNLMGFDADTLGSDNFYHGIAYLQRAINVAQFDFVAANLEGVEDNLRDVQRYRIFEVQGVKVAVVGVTDPGSPALVFPGNFGSIRVTDPVQAALEARDESAHAGAEVFVLVTEIGATDSTGGLLIDLARRLQGFDAILGRSFGDDFSAVINEALVVANQARGASFARTTLHYEAGLGVTQRSVSFVTPEAGRVSPAPDIEALVATYRNQLAIRLSQVLATSTAPLPASDLCGQPQGRTCESLAGDLVADALRAAQDADFAIVNAGSIRGPLTCTTAGGPGFCPATPALAITEGLLQSTLPFRNRAVTIQVSGAELKAMLENGVSAMPSAEGRFPQVSGLCFTYDISRPAGSRVTGAVRQLDGGRCDIQIDLTEAARYILATNDFIAAGGDGYPRPAATPLVGRTLVDLLRAYLEQAGMVTPGATGRIVCTSAGIVACPSTSGGVSRGSPPETGLLADSNIRPPATGEGGLR